MNKKARQGWGPGERAEQHYLVQPRTLAGAGDIRHVSEFLRASGWRDTSPSRGPLSMDSPERTVRIAYDPDSPHAGWIVHGRTGPGGEWSAHLSRQIPVEILAGLSDALTRPPSAHAPNVWTPLREQNWHTRFESGHYLATSPDGTAWMQYRQDLDGPGMWWTGAKDTQGTSWTALFTPTTPLHLVQAFSAELANPDPVMRPRGHLPHSTQIRTWSVSVTPSQLSAWQQARVTAARAATWARTNARSAPPRAGAPTYASARRARNHR
ncbi:DUF317 domain-containing protein [Streptomyces sp. 8L]|uniref:DUF317 domain-containing protein n=1 Tax=Streptomyces sp. 8L TaxID=2877242 RepID=UPI001CD7DECC|nr:DUF317 domain-containing protein [Streptomyces sp. 8L]MCA1223525.1 DUF317 domain-containing protein [Streptomyces sp. 8L]